MFGIRVVEEDGSIIQKMVAHPKFNPVRAGIDATKYPMLGSIDPYGDTSLNYLQCAMLVNELREGGEVLTGMGVAPEFIHELIRLCQLSRSKPHRQLLFIGD